VEAPNHLETEKSELKGKIETLIGKAKAACERLEEQTAAAAKATDKTIREHPYEAIGVAFGVGVLLGVLAVGSRHD
jgi:ElaB/YqjD/DUF883 family membrane-anchored ribosome-binding protein